MKFRLFCFFVMRKINVSYTQRSLIRKKKNRYLDYDSIEFTGDEEYFQIQYIIKSLLEVQKPICRNSASLFRTLLCIDIYLPTFYTSISGYKICVRLYLNGDGSVRGSHISILRFIEMLIFSSSECSKPGRVSTLLLF
jgi:hypothetical protein